MPIFLAILAVLAFVIGGGVLLFESRPTHGIEGLLLWVISALLLVGDAAPRASSAVADMLWWVTAHEERWT